MKVALVHDYLNEFGGAERVLLALSEIWPEAPIYTAFIKDGSAAAKRFAGKDIRVSWAQKIPGFVTKLHSPLRFLAPLIWESFNFDEYDVVVSSSSWYITKGILTRPETLHVSYIHTPPRYLYGFSTTLEWQKYWPIRLYATVVNKGLRQYDYITAQRVDVMVANSKEVERRIEKFWRRSARVIYPPVEISGELLPPAKNKQYFLTGGRLVGSKHFNIAVAAANKLNLPLIVYGDGPLREELLSMAGKTVEFVGHVNEERLYELYAGARAFIALAHDEDFGITPVEAMAAGCPVIAYKGGGYTETVTEKTGIFVDEVTAEKVSDAMELIETREFSENDLRSQAKKFSKERFKHEMSELVHTEYEKMRHAN